MRKSLATAVAILQEKIVELEAQESSLRKRGDKLLADSTAKRKAKILSAFYTLSEALESWPKTP